MSIGTVTYIKNSNTTNTIDQKNIEITHARALRIALSEIEEEATYQGFGADHTLKKAKAKKETYQNSEVKFENKTNYFYGDVLTKDKYNKEIFKEINSETYKNPIDKPYDFSHAIDGKMPSPITNKFANFIRMRNSTDEQTDQNKFRTSITYSKSIYGAKSYKITFSIQDDEASMTPQDKADYKYNKLTNLLHNRKNSMTFDLSEEEALFISQYIQDENTGTLINNIDPAQVAMQYLLDKQDISEYTEEDVAECELEGPDGKEYKTVCDEQKIYINTLATILRKDFGAIDRNKITVTSKRDKIIINKREIELEFSINGNDKVRIQYEELLEKTIGTSGKETFKVARRTNPYIVKVEKGKTKKQNDIDRRNNTITKPVLNTLIKQYKIDRCNNLLSNVEAKIINYAIMHAHKYEIFLQNNSNLGAELQSINAIDNDSSFAQKLVSRLKHANALAAACNFFMNDTGLYNYDENKIIQKRNRIIQKMNGILDGKNISIEQKNIAVKERKIAIAERDNIFQGINNTFKERNSILKELEELEISKEILFTKLLGNIQLKANNRVCYLKDYAPIAKDYTKNIGSYYKPLLKENKFALAFYLANNVQDMESIKQFFNNSGITCQKLHDILSLSNYDDKESIRLFNDIYFAQDKGTIDQIKQLEIEKICVENRNSVLEFIAKRHSSENSETNLDCYSIQNPDDRQNIAYAIRDNSKYFAKDQIVTDIKSFLSEKEYKEYKEAERRIGRDNNYIKSAYDDTKGDDRVSEANKITQAQSKVDGIEVTRHPTRLIERTTYIENRTVNHAQLYVEKLMQLYSLLGIGKDEIPLRSLNADGLVSEKIQERFKTYLFNNYEEYKKDIIGVNHSKDNNTGTTLLNLSNQYYIARNDFIEPTELHNSLLYACTGNNIEQLSRESIFTVENIKNRFSQMTAQMSKDIGSTGFLGRAGSIETIKSKYNHEILLENIGTGYDKDDLYICRELSEYLINSKCSLDIEITAPIIAKAIKKNILIVERENLGQLSYTLIRHELDDRYIEYYNNLDQIKERDNKDTIFIYKTYDNEKKRDKYEWLQKIKNIQDVEKDVKNKKSIEDKKNIEDKKTALNRRIIPNHSSQVVTQPQNDGKVLGDKGIVVGATKNKSYSRSNIELANNKIYNIKTTSGEDNNCLIYAITKGNIGNLNRQTIFSPENIREHLIQTEGTNDEIAAGVVTGNTLMTIIEIVRAIYNELSDVLNNVPSLDVLAATLSNHIIINGDFLDTQIAGSMIARQLAKNVLIITPENGNRLSYSFILDNGRFSDERDLDKIERDYPNVVFIYNRNGTHFEWLEKVTNDVQNVS